MVTDRNIVLTLFALSVVILFFGLTDADIWIQNHFFDFGSGRWLVDRDNPVLAFVFYDGIKKLLIIAASIILLALVFAYRHPLIRRHRRGLTILLLSVIIVPAVVNGLKAATNMPCPKNLEIYGGEYPHTCVWEKYPSTFCKTKKIKCWPAGHASGGFALLSLYFLFRSRRAKTAAVTGALVLGWSMGTYKMAIGDHFFSHTVISMVMGWLIILLIVRLVDVLIGRFQKPEIVQ